ncbi:hypothetical protein [Marivivens aquimaris]|uniref:hypothetical protein n=1 Tax=Marivivens aquimaris TaxID=2774876 RepID=UPI001881D6EA|nr:hypothetical protein [Marivivens aquimaris]
MIVKITQSIYEPERTRQIWYLFETNEFDSIDDLSAAMRNGPVAGLRYNTQAYGHTNREVIDSEAVAVGGSSINRVSAFEGIIYTANGTILRDCRE